MTLRTAPAINTSTIGVNSLGSGSLAAGVYQYKFALVDSSGKESTPSAAVSATIGGGGRVDFTTLPTDPNGGDFTSVNIYRTGPGGSDFFLLGNAAAGGSFTDSGTVPLGTQALDSTTLTGNYTYMITYGKVGEPDSRPSVFIGPRNVVNGRLSLKTYRFAGTDFHGWISCIRRDSYLSQSGRRSKQFLPGRQRPAR